MAKEKPPEPPAEDIPAWFMTYSDVITLLMTFFILLLTFATTEPERFEKVKPSAFGVPGASGIAGHKHEGLDKTSWVQRIRPRAARISMFGSEMPPMIDQPSSEAVGQGLKAVNDEESKQDVMKTHSFEMDFETLIDKNSRVTQVGIRMANKLSDQLKSLPVHCSIEVGEQKYGERAADFMVYMYDVEKVRPGQVGVGFADDLSPGKVRITIERYP